MKRERIIVKGLVQIQFAIKCNPCGELLWVFISTPDNTHKGKIAI